MVAIVGTRKATAQGIKIAEQFAEEFSRKGVIVVSGLAMGIDAAAHRGALKGSSPTVAVLGCGIDTIYPARNENLAQKMLEQNGVIISEYPPDSPSFPGNFISRNRIISGLCLGVVIIEAPQRSGALSTAGFAGEQGRQVFVVPGPINNPNYAGSHALIRDGATLVTNPAEVLADLNLIEETESEKQEKVMELTETEMLIFGAIKKSGEALDVDRIQELTKLPIQAINQAVSLMVLRRIIQEANGKYSI